MHTVTIIGTLADNYTYVIESYGSAVVIDPGEASPVMRSLDRSCATLLASVCTHGHFDHTGGNEELLRRTSCQVLVPGASDGDATLNIGPFTFTVLRTPGHSADSVCLYVRPTAEQPGDLFTGDTLFCGGCGRLFTRSPETMWDSLQKLAVLPPDTRVFCGHDYMLENYEFASVLEPDNEEVYARLQAARALAADGSFTVPSTIAVERASNPFLRAGDPRMKRALGMESSSDVEVFAAIRRSKDRF